MSNEKKQGFFDTYRDEGGGQFLSAEEKELLIDEGVAFPVTSVASSESEFGPRWVVGIELEGEPRLVGFSRGKVFSRDRLLEALQGYLAEEGAEPPELRIVMNKRSQLLVSASEDPSPSDRE